MSTNPPESSRALPDRPNLQHLKDQAKDLLKAGQADSLTDAQFRIARLYGFSSWPKLKAHVDSLQEVGSAEEIEQLKQAIDANNSESVKILMSRNPALHRAPVGYSKNGPLTWVAECRVPWEPPSPQRLAMAKWMIENGSDVHQGGDGPLMRAALIDHRIPMMELLVSRGADVNAEWDGYFPILFAPCETVQPASIKWLLDHGANPNCAKPNRKYPGTALDQVITTYGRSLELGACIDILVDPGADVNASATVSEQGIGGHSPIFHAVTQYGDWGLPVTQLLVERGANLAVRARLPGHYERPGEVVECTPFGYAKLFPGTENKTVSFLRQRAAP